MWSVDGCVVFSRRFYRRKMLFERIYAGSWLVWQLLGLVSSHGCTLGFLLSGRAGAKGMELGPFG